MPLNVIYLLMIPKLIPPTQRLPLHSRLIYAAVYSTLQDLRHVHIQILGFPQTLQISKHYKSNTTDQGFIYCFVDLGLAYFIL